MHKTLARMRRRRGQGDQTEPTGDRRRHLLIIAAVAVVAAVAVLHLTGVIGAGTH